MVTDIFTEPDPIDLDTLANLGPLAPLAGRWEGRGEDLHPVAEGEEKEPYLERIDFEPIDPQANGPQLLYGLRYHVFITKVGEQETFHDQVGYWLWEPATGMLMQTLAIPRGQVVLAGGRATPDAREFELVARADDPCFGIRSAPFLEHAFRTIEYRIKVSVHPDGNWSYEEDTVMEVRGRTEPFHHTDRSTLIRLAGPTPNPLARR